MLRRAFLSSLLALTFVVQDGRGTHPSSGESGDCCAAAEGLAACNGSSPCKVCTNCSRCKHCKGSGTCGMCSK